MATQTVLITGAEGALGSVVRKRFATAGYQVIGTYHPGGTPPTSEDSATRFIKVDLANSATVHQTISSLGDIDVLVHCAGGFRYAQVENTSDDDLDFLFNSNLRSSFLLLRELLPSMKKRNFGRIVLISSKATLQAPAGMSAYCAAKAGINALVSSAAEEVKAFDINVNAVMPTVIDTPANRRDMPKANFASWVTPNELAEIIFSLTQPFGKPVHGALIPISGRI